MLYIIAAVFCFTLIGMTGGEVVCNPANNNTCGAREVFQTLESLVSFPSEDFFKEHCRTFEDSVTCLIGEIEQGCHTFLGSAELQIDKISEYKGLLVVVKEFCKNESSVRHAYLEHVNCFNTVKEKLRKCSLDRRPLLHLFVKEKEEDFEFEYECVASDIMVNCYAAKIAKVCGIPAASAFVQIPNLFTTNSDINPVCSPIKKQIYSDELLTFALNNADKINNNIDNSED